MFGIICSASKEVRAISIKVTLWHMQVSDKGEINSNHIGVRNESFFKREMKALVVERSVCMHIEGKG